MIKAIFLGLLLSVVILGIVIWANRQTIVDLPTPEVYKLSDTELHSLEKKALGGDARSAFRVYQYFKWSKNDEVEACKWQKLGDHLEKDSDTAEK